MFETTPYIRFENEATPDKIKVPKWGYEMYFRKNDWIIFTLVDGRLYVGTKPTTHIEIYKDVKPYGIGFDGRLWKDGKILTFWCDTGLDKKEIKKRLDIMKTKFLNMDYINRSPEEPIGVIDLTEYTIMFLGHFHCPPDVFIIKCDWDSFFSEEFELKYTDDIRFNGGKNLWKDRLRADMDDAERHLLLYEE